MNLGEKLRQLRQDRDLTQPALAASLGIEQSYLSKLETGKSLPSNDVLLRILDVFSLDVGALVDDLDQGARNQLRQIPDVAEHFKRQRALIIGNRRRWLLGSAASLALGVMLVYAGSVGLIAGSVAFTYESHGITREGESKELFRALFDWQWRQVAGYEGEALLEDLRARLDQRYIHTRNYRGDLFSVPVEGGTRTYSLRDVSMADAWQNKAAAALGVLLMTLGAVGIGLEKKLSRFQ